MTDTTVTTEAPILTLPTEAPLTNSPEARSTDGTLKDQSLAGITTPTTPTPTDTTKPPTAAPETYADFKLPEGATVSADLLKDATAIFKASGLSQDAAQQLVDLYTKDVTKTAEAPQKVFNEMVLGWRNEVLKDPNLATGDTLRADVNENIGKLKASLNDPKAVEEFNKVMNMSGLGNHPAIVTALNKWGSQLSEGKHVAGNGPSTLGQVAPGTKDRPSVAKAMFPSLP